MEHLKNVRNIILLMVLMDVEELFNKIMSWTYFNNLIGKLKRIYVESTI